MPSGQDKGVFLQENRQQIGEKNKPILYRPFRNLIFFIQRIQILPTSSK
jgi:hypothetical protein